MFTCTHFLIFKFLIISYHLLALTPTTHQSPLCQLIYRLQYQQQGTFLFRVLAGKDGRSNFDTTICSFFMLMPTRIFFNHRPGLLVRRRSPLSGRVESYNFELKWPWRFRSTGSTTVTAELSSTCYFPNRIVKNLLRSKSCLSLDSAVVHSIYFYLIF